MDWIVIQSKYVNSCVECKTFIDIETTCFWKKGVGIKCYPECLELEPVDQSELAIIEDSELSKTVKPLGKKYF